MTRKEQTGTESQWHSVIQAQFNVNHLATPNPVNRGSSSDEWVLQVERAAGPGHDLMAELCPDVLPPGPSHG
ncbi:MAG: hypothetical protein JWN70_5975 [Planctomycetaceae bacterium]|nr:hypothetical protein [Planctomycetaceae bacterium]